MALLPTGIIFLEEAGFEPFREVGIELRFGFDIVGYGRARGKAGCNDMSRPVRESILFDFLVRRGEIERPIGRGSLVGDPGDGVLKFGE